MSGASASFPSMDERKATLHRYLVGNREALLSKLEGLSERELRLPRTPTGTNLLGLVKHVALIQAGYLGDVFGRPTPDLVLWGGDDDPNADLYAGEGESQADVLAVWERSCAIADEQIGALQLDAEGAVPWWPEERRRVTLHAVLVHLLSDLCRHTGHADILREGIDGSAGLNKTNPNLPEGYDWASHVEKLRRIADLLG